MLGQVFKGNLGQVTFRYETERFVGGWQRNVVVNGRVVGKVRGLKVRLTSTARVEGDIIHKTIAIESGAHFEGSVQRQEDPLNGSGKAAAKPTLSSD